MAWEGWTDETLAEAKRLWGKGYSGTQIAREIRAPSRSSVISKLHRLGVTTSMKREQTVPRNQGGRPVKRKPTRTIPTVVKTQPLPKPPPPAPESRHVRLEDLERCDCRYPYGTEPPFTFCGAKAEEGSAYCAAHRTATTRKEKAAAE